MKRGKGGPGTRGYQRGWTYLYWAWGGPGTRGYQRGWTYLYWVWGAWDEGLPERLDIFVLGLGGPGTMGYQRGWTYLYWVWGGLGRGATREVGHIYIGSGPLKFGLYEHFSYFVPAGQSQASFPGFTCVFWKCVINGITEYPVLFCFQ